VGMELGHLLLLHYYRRVAFESPLVVSLRNYISIKNPRCYSSKEKH
jgi:hypothetical protein